MKRHYISLILCGAALAVSAQQLNKEIVIDREIDPAQRAATRISAYPTLVQPKIDNKNLSFSDVTTSVEVPAMVATLEPATPEEAIELSPWRGYASLGYFPIYNLAGSLGYRFIQSDYTSMGGWLQFDGRSFNDKIEDEKLNRNTLTAALDFTHVFRHAGRLDLNADMTCDRLNRPWEEGNPSDNAYKINLRGVWSARRSDIAYFGSGSFGYFGLGGNDKAFMWVGDPSSSLSQMLVNVKGGASYRFDDKMTLAALVSGDVVSYSSMNVVGAYAKTPTGGEVAPVIVPAFYRGDGKTMGLLTLNPSLRYRSGMLRAVVGLKAQFTANSGKAIHVAPDIRVNVKPSDFLTATLKLGGGEHINKLYALYEANPWGARSLGYGFSHLPLTADLDLLIGPFKGASLRLFGGYAVANDWLMPEMYSANFVAYKGVDLKSLHYGAEASVKFNKLFSANVRYIAASGAYKRSYYLNPDRAKGVLDARLTVNPVERLSVDASFEIRSGRSIYSSFNPAVGVVGYKLKTSNSLNVGARYEISERLSVFARLENLLDNRAEMLCLREKQGFAGLLGAAYKF